MDYVLGRIVADNYALQPGFLRAARCTLARAAHSRPAAFFALDLSVTALLLAIFFLEEMWELLVVLISNWFMISLLHRYYQNRGRSKTGRHCSV
ncbi:hypothetical protein BS78_05G009000 [Paspalum vaginatum]|nr:hypothetical protein BS78_05G009000 [Paspalum vaginatum]